VFDTPSKAPRGAARVLHGLASVLFVCVAVVAFSSGAEARPNTHAPAISTWDPRASSVVFGLGRSMSGDGSFTFTSYNANFSSTNGVLSAQFGVHYVTFDDTAETPTARGVSAGGVALISLPLSSRFDNGVPGTAFAFYIGGVPTAMFSGQLNFISVPLVLGVGLPYSPARYVTFRPWVELSPGFNFDTRIQEISTNEAIQAAMDGTLTRQEVEDLVEQGLDIRRKTTVGKRAGLSIAAHLGERVDLDVNMMLGAGHAGALSLGAGLVLRWDAMVHDLGRDSRDGARDGRGGASDEESERESCEALAARYHRTCRLRRPKTSAAEGRSAPRPRSSPARPDRAGDRSGALRQRAPLPAPTPAPSAAPRAAEPPATAPAVGVTPATKSKKPAPANPASPVAPAPAPRPQPGELPPLQAAPPRTP
jgi:hypothetical protein